MDQELSDPVIGLLTHDGYYYNGSGTYGDVQFEFTIGTYKVADVPARLEKARAIYRAVDSVVDRTANYAASKLLELKNDSWEEEDGKVISHQEFKERLVISSITLDHDGDLVIYFEDGDLFFGHHVMVTESSDGSLDRAEIQG
jgi:hypothetical protein